MLILEQVEKIYPSGSGPLTVLHPITLRVAARATCAVIGPSGSGKTTLLGLCAGLDRPSAGRIECCGVDLDTQSEEELAALRRERIGFIFQSFRLIPSLTALENVMIPAELQGDRDARTRALDLLGQVGLSDRHTHYPSQLSGGEQQRVAVARAFIHHPQIIFADEPTGNLDDETGQRILDQLFDLNRTRGTTLVIVTHDHALTERVDTIVTLRGGRIISA